MAPKASRPRLSTVWREASELVWTHRRRLGVGLVLMLINRSAGLVLPATSKYLVDDVIGNQRVDLLPLLALAVAGATLVQAGAAFSLTMVLSVAAQRAITEMRKTVQAHVLRLPVRYFDSTQSGTLVAARFMTDAEGIRNLVGTGLTQLAGGLVTATVALGVLCYLNWRLTLMTAVILAAFGAGMVGAFTRLRPLFRERGKINAEVTGRLTEALGGIRIVKTYVAEKREELVFARGAHRLLRNVAKSLTGVAAVSTFATIIIGAVGVLMMVVGGRAILSGSMTLGDLVMYIFFTGLLAAPVIQIASIGTQLSEAFAGLDRIRELRQMATEDEHDAERRPMPDGPGEIVFEDVCFEYTAGVPVLRNVSFRSAAGSTTALVGVERLRQEHADQPGHGLQPARLRPGARRRRRSRLRSAPRVSRASRRGVAGQLPLRWHDCREHRLRGSSCHPRGHRRGEPRRSLSGVHRGIPGRLRHGRRRAGGSGFRADSASESPSRGRFSPNRSSSCSTRPRRASTARARA